MSTKQVVTAKEVLSMLTDIPENVSECGDESCSLDADDDFIPAADKSNSSSEDKNVNAANVLQLSRMLFQLHLKKN